VGIIAAVHGASQADLSLGANSMIVGLVARARPDWDLEPLVV